jgi:flagellar motor protein MotB
MALFAQPYSIVIEGPFEDVLFDITQDFNRDISAAGFSQHYNQDTPSQQKHYSAFDYLETLASQSGEQIRLIRLNEHAHINFDFSNTLTRFNRAVSLIKTSDNGYFLGGYTQDGELLLLKLSSSGSLKFQRQFGTKNYDRMNRLVALRDGGVLAVGSSMTSRSQKDPQYTQGIGLNDIYLTRFDRQGNITWSKKYGTRSDDRGIDATEAFDGTLLLLSNFSDQTTQGISLMRLSEEGDKIWMHNYESEGILNAHRLITLRDNHFLTAISYYDANHAEQTRLIKFDLQKNILQEHNITTQGSNVISDIKERSNGAIVGVGHHTTHLKTEAMAITLDNTLHPIWKRYFDNFERSAFHALSVLHDGKIAVAGEVNKHASEVTDMWILKLNSDGSTTQMELHNGSLYDALCAAFSKEIQEKTLSITEDLTLHITAASLRFQVGEYELSSQQRSFLHRFNTKLFTTLYPYKEKIKTLHVNGHTSSEWGNLNLPKRYLNNVELSAKRAFKVLEFTYQDDQLRPYQEWMHALLSSDAHSYSERIIDKNENENELASRRVSFKIEMK